MFYYVVVFIIVVISVEYLFSELFLPAFGTVKRFEHEIYDDTDIFNILAAALQDPVKTSVVMHIT